MQQISKNPIISSAIFGSNPINNIPKKEVKIKIHFFLLMDSFINIELTIIASGIDNCAPITKGAIILDEFNDKYKNRFTAVPIEIEKPTNGRKYFLFGNLNSKKGNKQINTMVILKQPNKIGGTDMFIPSFPVG